jgi:hypothetical protein
MGSGSQCYVEVTGLLGFSLNTLLGKVSAISLHTP